MSKDDSKILLWFCADCKLDTLQTGKVIHSLKDKQEKLEAKQKELEHELDVVKAELEGSKKEMKEQGTAIRDRPTREEVLTMIEVKLNENELKQKDKPIIEPMWSEIVSKHVDTKREMVTSQ